MNPSYIATNVEELLNSASPDILEIIHGDEVKSTSATLGKIYKIPMSAYLPLSNTIYLTLIGAIKPEDVVRAVKEMVGLTEADAYKLAEDLDKSIFQKARISVLGKGTGEIKTLVFDGEKSVDELRKEILDTTKRDLEPVKSAGKESGTKKQIMLTPGSRSQLLEQLQLLEAIPKDDEVETRLGHIKEQLDSIDKKQENTLDSNIALKEFMFGERGTDVVVAETRSATYSKAPTKYNVDPYRETVGV